ncbi:hypothetical protein EUX98_g105 [Antrodiella citrinella]|uniref:Rad21/Rec8-like protein C-terminal eukaryotic domain-containing protein n=1 Tax=Antrodiella citrinella TaxID=2447956 RepID=A0A4S4N753_9APHY|nr:hypothetical protein EUX98_g105 [Antrodiella citrinella]
MFFTPELLSRRDSGFGLLWLAATLGSKSSFKKLPRRSVTSADIVQLCNLIADPPEPLALRLSSNLMIGAASANQRIRPDAVTVRADPSAAFAIEFEHLFPEWDKTSPDEGDDQSDDEYDPTSKKTRKKKDKETPLSHIGPARGDLHTLKENYDYLLSQTFDVSFNESGLGVAGASSSQAGFGFDDDFLVGVDAGPDIGDELARELGDGWGVFPEDRAPSMGVGANVRDVDMIDTASGLQLPQNAGFDEDFVMADVHMEPDLAGPPALEQGHIANVGSPRESGPEIPEDGQDNGLGTQDEQRKPKKPKRVRLLLDSRTELTNEELQRARALYMEEQAKIRRELDEKRAEKDGEVLLQEMISGVPSGLHAPVLIDFWLENFKVQVQARSGQLVLDTEGEPPKKRRRVEHVDPVAFDEQNLQGADGMIQFDGGLHQVEDYNAHYHNDMQADAESKLRSSEEPGQARQMSRPPSVPGSHLDLYNRSADVVGSQRSAVFPWDNAGGISSSAAGAPFEMVASDKFSVSVGRGRKSSSLGSRRGSSMLPVPNSPAGLNFGDQQMDGDGFEFNVPEGNQPGVDTQQSDLNMLTLERHSFDFLEYCKMQLNAFPTESNSVGFDDIVPLETSTPHVAAAAFYHCLVLATKDAVRLEQDESFAPVRIFVK